MKYSRQGRHEETSRESRIFTGKEENFKMKTRKFKQVFENTKLRFKQVLIRPKTVNDAVKLSLLSKKLEKS